MARRDTLRLIDANINRALEGTRVCEELIRFTWRNPTLFRRFRTLRHSIARAAEKLPANRKVLLKSRSVGDDPGRLSSTSRIRSLDKLLIVNLQRMKESLRTLEECSRVISPASASRFQALRFRTYEIERSVLLKLASLRHR